MDLKELLKVYHDMAYVVCTREAMSAKEKEKSEENKQAFHLGCLWGICGDRRTKPRFCNAAAYERGWQEGKKQGEKLDMFHSLLRQVDEIMKT